jgi:CheY-like chemotaxis protein
MSLILVIDDEAQFRVMVRRMLEAEGHQVIEAENGREGLEKVRTSSPDMIVTDMIMPEKSGIETILQIRELNPKMRIVAVSGGGMASDLLSSAMSVGADEVLAKPFRATDLLRAIDDR